MGASDFAKLPHIGEAVRRKEDYRFLTGNGQYTDDIQLAHQRYAVFVRSPHAHATIRRVDTSRAQAMPGVAKVFTGADIAGKMNGLPCGWLITSTDGQPMKEPPHPVLAQDKVRYVGDQVAMVVADTLEQARNAAEAVEVEYDVLPAVVDVRDAAKASALHDIAADNHCYKWAIGDKAALITTPIINRGRDTKQKGTRNAGSMQNVFAKIDDDAGQIAVIAAEGTSSNYAFKIVFDDAATSPASPVPVGSQRLFVGLVTTAQEAGGAANTVQNLNVTIEINSNIVHVAANP